MLSPLASWVIVVVRLTFGAVASLGSRPMQAISFNMASR